MKLSIIIPVYNELDTLEDVVDLVRRADVAACEKEIIVVDDFSTDGTRAIYPKLKDRVSRVILHDRNRGKGAALRTGFAHASGDLVMVQDADLEYDPGEYRLLLDPILAGKADVVYGSRFMGGRPHRVLLFWHMVGNSFLTLLCNMLTNLTLTDMETCYKVFRREVLDCVSLREDRFGFEPEITAKVAAIPGIRIYEVGISYSGRTYEEGKKVGWRDGFRALYCVVRYSPPGQRLGRWLSSLVGMPTAAVPRLPCYRALAALLLSLFCAATIVLRAPGELRTRADFVRHELSAGAGTASSKMQMWRGFGRRCQEHLDADEQVVVLADPRSERTLATRYFLMPHRTVFPASSWDQLLADPAVLATALASSHSPRRAVFPPLAPPGDEVLVKGLAAILGPDLEVEHLGGGLLLTYAGEQR